VKHGDSRFFINVGRAVEGTETDCDRALDKWRCSWGDISGGSSVAVHMDVSSLEKMTIPPILNSIAKETKADVEEAVLAFRCQEAKCSSMVRRENELSLCGQVQDVETVRQPNA